MNPEADLSLWHVNLYGIELKLLLLLSMTALFLYRTTDTITEGYAE
jgi:hypothetical protein